MAITRRGFIKAAGVTTVAAAGMVGTRAVIGELTKPRLAEETPLRGKRWAMIIDIKKCQKEIRDRGCRDCIVACHLSHNVPNFGNPKDEIKWIWHESFEHGFHGQEHEYMKKDLRHSPVVLMCNHCDNPPCTKVCPTQATWKRPDGIVMMDWHRCIGCRFCVAACPYGSRSFNWRDPREFIADQKKEFPTRHKGVVEKCTFCDERLGKGLLPECVEACKAKALVFGDLDVPGTTIRRLLEENYTIRRRPELGTKPEVYYII